jgi:hypothetical protein
MFTVITVTQRERNKVIRARNAVKALGLCALVLGLMAIGTGAAQAEKGSHWNVNGKAITAELLVKIGATLENNHGILLSNALGKSFHILCTAMAFEEAELKVEGGSSGKIKFTGCIILLGGVLSKPCEPKDAGVAGVILTKLLKDLILLHEGEPVDELEPVVAPLFALIETSAECAFGSSIPVIGGRFTFQDCQKEGRIEKVTHLGTELAALTELWILSKTAEHVARIDGSANVSLIGEHAGLTWSGTPF